MDFDRSVPPATPSPLRRIDKVFDRFPQLQQQQQLRPGEKQRQRSPPVITPPRPTMASSSGSSERFRPSALSFWQNRESQAMSPSPSSGSAVSTPLKDSAASSSLQTRKRESLVGSPTSPRIVGLDEELEERDRRSLEARREESSTTEDINPPFTLSLQHEESSGSAASSSREASPWNSQSEWAKHESFVLPLDVLPTDEVADDSDAQEILSSEAARERAKRRRKKLLQRLKRDQMQKRGEKSDRPMVWSSSSEEEEGSVDSSYRSGRLVEGDDSSPTPANELPSSSALTPEVESDTFYDAKAGGSSTHSSSPPKEEASWLSLSPYPQHTTASSATLRQDALEQGHDLQHQGSSSTLLAIAEGIEAKPRRRLGSLPPPRPSPKAPLPPTPDAERPNGLGISESPAEAAAAAAEAEAEKAAIGTTAVDLGPSGTIRGRPRGATVGAGGSGSSSKVDVKQRVRPRSMLCNEVSGDSASPQSRPDSSTTPPPATATTRTSEDGDKNSRRTSLAATSSIPAEDASASRSSLGMHRTPSSSAASSSVGLVGSSANSSDHGGNGNRSRSGSTASLLQQVQQNRPKSHASFVIAVVGHRDAGKSTVIKKGLRQFGLSKPHVLSEKITSHSTVCIVDHEQRTIEVLEMDASVLLSGPSKRFAWPKFLPHIDAVILCYDASQISSFRGMSELLENFALNSLSTVMLACKSEIHPKAVDPYYASDMALVYNVGLAECSVQSEEGKKRMRDCFSFLVKEVAKARAAVAKGQSVGLPAANVVSQDSSLRGPLSESEANWRVPAESKTTGMSDEVKQSIQKAQLGLQSAQSEGGYVSVEELWDKLFYAAVSGNDERYLLMIMVFYRGFAQPIDLLRQLIARFDALSKGERKDSVMIKYSLMRLTTMLGDWMQEYPGDLSQPETYQLLGEFFDRLLGHPSTMHVASPMKPLLESVRDAPDVDAIWSRNQDSDRPRSVAADVPPVKPTRAAVANAVGGKGDPGTPGTPNSEGHVGQRARSHSQSSSVSESYLNPPRMLRPVENRQRSASDVTDSSDGQASGYSGASGSSLTASTMGSPAPSQQTSSKMSSSQMSATGLEQKTILRNISNSLFEVKDEAIAQELTRIEWDLFSAVGSRDLLRHILVSRELRSSDSPVAMSIAHFNYISSWICSMILVQSKTKQRARLLEKFMDIAGILRRINNYNSLHAVLAGLGNASIHRMKNTRQLLNGKPVMKTYQSLARLMGSDRSFAAYRLALQNSQGRTIPYLGVHLQDILSTSDGNPSKRAGDGMVHWKKFTLMDEAVMGIIRCQQYQEPLRENTTISKLILNLPVMDEDTLYQRSLQVEPRQTNGLSTSAGSRIIKRLFDTET